MYLYFQTTALALILILETTYLYWRTTLYISTHIKKYDTPGFADMTMAAIAKLRQVTPSYYLDGSTENRALSRLLRLQPLLVGE